MRRVPSFLAAALAVAAAIGAGAQAAAAAGDPDCPLPVFGPGAGYHPQISSAGPDVTNPWFPLTPGTTLVYTGVKDDGKALDVVTPSSRTRVIAGVTTRVVEDRLYLDNVLEERTSDYYAQDSCGNVWYFGEDTAELDANGTVVSTDGSWHAGVDGAQPGLIMQEEPTVGRRFRQEFLSGEAEDTFKVLSLSASVKVPAGAFAGVMRTRETTALEPGVLDNKYYVRGIGEVEEITVRGPTEALRLVEVIS